MKIGRYDVPLDYFKNVITKYPDHAFGHYFISKCYRGMDNMKMADMHMSRFLEICEHDEWWYKTAVTYGVHFAPAAEIQLPTVMPSMPAIQAAMQQPPA